MPSLASRLPPRLPFVVATALVALTLPLSAQTLQCAPRENVLSMLGKQTQTRKAMGLAGRAVMEVFADPASMRWTITVTLPDGRMCLLANGQAYEATDEIFPPQDVPS